MLRSDQIDREILLGHLSRGICKVFFRKVTNGRYRTIYCSLNEKTLPRKIKKSLPQIFSFNSRTLELIPIYDIIEGEWKSFYIPNVLYFYTPEDLVQSEHEYERIKEFIT